MLSYRIFLWTVEAFIGKSGQTERGIAKLWANSKQLFKDYLGFSGP